MEKGVTYTIVKVINDTTLIDAKSMARAYTSQRSLVPGSYVVVWRPDSEPWRYDCSPIFFGPFATEGQIRGWLKIFVDVLDSGGGADRPAPADSREDPRSGTRP